MSASTWSCCGCCLLGYAWRLRQLQVRRVRMFEATDEARVDGEE
jgi:hypothetical protein